MTSLRARAVTGGILWAVAIIVLGLAGVSSYLTSQTQARFIEVLETRHAQAIVAVSNNSDSTSDLVRAIGDLVYQVPNSGQYWQVQTDVGAIYASPSLGEERLPSPFGRSGERRMREVAGPNDETVFTIGQWVSVSDGSLWHVQVASSLRSFEEDQVVLRNTLLTAFAFVSFVGVLGALTQVAVVLQPLNKLRHEVSGRWEQDDKLEVESYPIEVAPLVNDINTLMERNRDIMRRSRRQAADLAHAIKTPSAIMRNELDNLMMEGAEVQEAVDALDRLDAQLKRSFARMRADGTDATVGVATELDTALGRMQRAFNALARNEGKTFTADYDNGLRVRMDQSDFEEVMGNLLDNALKWAASEVQLKAGESADGQIMITITDDGPGIPKEEIAKATQSGQRLDTSKPGTGLGLAIAHDLIHAYGGKILLSQDEDLGGLAIHMRLPFASAKRSD
ncbi:sensor histidine kinase [Roseobacter sp. CCS2]|uniref:sensor histidine kinase n=1 Tax=Roseobacter sp. CCS2 TaxID=391593 RepID=UPI0000F3F5A6|nr:HAMP domain-containing sensor histidine kinase [Roseobacter sp. CCS2]EBA10757.1 periplasmic sensor signal transduction histidine kinase [Roseobacter sp. CCS2]